MTTAGNRAFFFRALGQNRRAGRVLFAGMVAWLLAVPAACLAGPQVLHTFSAPQFSQTGPWTNSDGVGPASTLAWDSNTLCFYGTTLHGGANGAGVIFRIGTDGSFTNLYSFPAATNHAGEVVFNLGPNDLVFANGTLYGTTRSGGSNFTGTIFEISTNGLFTNLHVFGAVSANGSGQATSPDGSTPAGALAPWNDGNFYGTTQYGGSNNTGTIFQLTPAGAFTNVYSFGPSVAGSATSRGAVPNALILGNDGVLYGTAQQGGLDNAGTLFRFTPTNGLTQILSFNGASPGKNPITPNSALVQDANGYFYGTSAYGGTQGGGSIFEITNAGVNLLYSFPYFNAGAGAGLGAGEPGSFFGTRAANGFNGSGTLFSITTAGGFGSYAFSGLNTNGNNFDGANPSAALTADGAGNYYGTCAAGGTNGSGIVFRVVGTNFIPPYFEANTNPPPARTNLLVGASITFSNLVAGSQPLTCEWQRNGTNLTDGGDISGAMTSVLMISPVNARDEGTYVLVISNTWGAVTSATTVLTVTPPVISISSPRPNSSTSAPVFAGIATNAPLYTNSVFNMAEVQLVKVSFALSNALNGSNLAGVASLSSGAGGYSNWTFSITPFPGTNILSVRCTDASGNTSAAATASFFYEVSSPLTIVTKGSGGATYNYPNGTLLNIGQKYTITATPVASFFSNWISGGLVTLNPKLTFLMESNLVLTNVLGAKQPPSVAITSPTANARTNAPVFQGTAQSSPASTGVNSNNVRLAGVTYWLTNAGSVLSGNATLTNGQGGVSNWSFTVVNLHPGSNTLAVQATDGSGDRSTLVSQSFFYIVPTNFVLLTNGSGGGVFNGSASISGDTPPTNGALLNIGEGYTITAQPDSLSTFSKWVTNAGTAGTNPTLTFIMKPKLTNTAFFTAKPPIVAITSPAANERTAMPVLSGTASGNFLIINVRYSLTNLLTKFGTNGSAKLTGGTGTVSNWFITNGFITNIPFAGSNILTVEATDVRGDTSPDVSQSFFYEVPTNFVLLEAGTGHGSVTGSASIRGDTPPTNGAQLNIGEGYTLTAEPDSLSTFTNWVSKWVGGAATSTQRTLTFIMKPGLTNTAIFAAHRPVVAITSPAANERTAAPDLSGTASGQFVITNVSYSLESLLTGSTTTGTAKLTGGSGTVSNWSIGSNGFVPFPGSNTLTVTCQDVSNVVSAPATRTFFFEVQTALTLTNAGRGNGTFTLSTKGSSAVPVASGATLYVGQGYTIIAKPDASSLFSNWVSSAGFGTDTAAFSFVMRSNLVLTVTFITNFFPDAAGIYNGLFFPSGGVAEETSGMLNHFVLTSAGAGSGRLLLAGNSYAVASKFDASGEAAFKAGPVQVSLSLDSTNRQITGTVSGGQWTANLTADLAATSNARASAEYTLLLSPSASVATNAPPGDGYVLVTNHAGTVTLSGALADGTRYNQTVPVSQAGEVPVYARLYTSEVNTNSGLLLGWVNLTNLRAAAPTNNLAWIKKASGSSKFYAKGFTNVLSVRGSPWTNPPAIALTNGSLVISNTGLILSFTNVSASDNSLANLADFPTNSLSGAIAPKTGLLTLTFAPGKGKATDKAFGAILQDTTNAGGFFLTATNAGAFYLEP